MKNASNTLAVKAIVAEYATTVKAQWEAFSKSTVVNSVELSETYTAAKEDGRIVMIVTPNVVGGMSDTDLAFRKMIVEDRTLEAVIQLPHSLNRGTASLFALCIDKCREDKEHSGVAMLDAGAITETMQVCINDDADNVCTLIPFEDVDAEILFPAYYLVSRPEKSIGLDRAFKVAAYDSHDVKENMPAVTVKNLSATLENAHLSADELSSVSECGHTADFVVVKSPCIFLCSDGSKVLAAYMSEIPQGGIAVSKKLNCFELKNENGSIRSVIHLLFEEYVCKQIMSMSVGKYIRKFDNALLSKVRIHHSNILRIAALSAIDMEAQASYNGKVDDISTQLLEAEKAYVEAQDAAGQSMLEAEEARSKAEDEAFQLEMEAQASYNSKVDEISAQLMLETEKANVEAQDAADQFMFEAEEARSKAEDEAFQLEMETQASYNSKVDEISAQLMLEAEKANVEAQDAADQFMFEADIQLLYDALERQKRQEIRRYEDYRKSIRMRKHALTQSLSAYGAMFNVLMKCRERHNGHLDDNDKISVIRDMTVADAFKFLKENLDSIQKKVASIADIEEDFGKSEDIKPKDFITSYIDKNMSAWLNFKANFECDDSMACSDNTLYIPIEALNRVFDNIISNARAHGFTDPERNDYMVRFSIEVSGMDMTIVIENNGEPIPAEVDAADVMEYGFSTSLNKNGHNGIGCSEIADILKKYDGSVQVVSTPDEPYTVKYVLTFNRTNTTMSL